jgi:acetyltransferase-like isoleucine patch superfamily enzyme
MTQQPCKTTRNHATKIAEPRRTLNFIKNRICPPPAPSLFMRENPEYASYNVGKFTYGYPKIVNYRGIATCKIGKFCSIAEGVTILLDGEHKPDWVTTYPFYDYVKGFHDMQPPHTKGDVVIGNDVWIGLNAIVLSGVCIGDGAVVGANAVVTKDVEPYAIVAGNPARLIRKRFNDETVKKLLKIKWWNWSLQRIKENAPFMFANKIDEFIDRNTVQ